MKKYIVLLSLILTISITMIPAAYAQEFGLVVNQYVQAGGNDGGNADTSFEYNALIVPRFLFLLGDGAGSIFASAGMTLGVSDSSDDDVTFVPELMRTELAMQWGAVGLSLGRIGYSTPLAFLAEGLFDGVQVSHSSSLGRFRAGAWYTGLLYKKSANIQMTENDRAIYYTPFDFDNFADTYFAPPRLLASLDWEHLAVADILRLNAAVTMQADLSDDLSSNGEKYNSQYFTIKAGMPYNSFFFELGGILSTFQIEGEGSFKPAFAGDIGVYWTLPASLNSRLSFNARFASGQSSDASGDGAGGFIPVTAKYAGNILEAGMSALTVLDLNYTARFTDKIGASISTKYFIQNGSTPLNTYPFSGAVGGGDSLGAELFARLIWSPVSDLQLNLSGGAFIPALGNYAPDAKPVWLVKLTAVFVAY